MYPTANVITVVSATLTLSSFKPAFVSPQINRVDKAAPNVPPITFTVGAPVSILGAIYLPPLLDVSLAFERSRVPSIEGNRRPFRKNIACKPILEVDLDRPA